MAKFITTLIFTLLTPLLLAQTSAPLGLPTTLTDIYIPGTEVEPIPRTDNKPSLVIRILEIKPAQDGFRYDLQIYGLDPGYHRISKYLRYKNTQQPVTKLKNTLEITTQLPLETLPKPQPLEQNTPPEQSHYRALLITAAILWTILFLAIIFYKKRKAATQQAVQEPTTQEKLQTLLLATAHGDLTTDEQAQLERLIIGHYKTQIPEIQNLPPTQALQKLKTHPQTSHLIQKIEQWLHHPNPKITQAEIQPLLNPFQ